MSSLARLTNRTFTARVPEWRKSGALLVAVAIVLAVIEGLSAGTGQLSLGILAIAAPILILTLVRLDWFPVIVIASAFLQALSIGGLSLSRAVGPIAAVALILGMPSRRAIRVRQAALPLAIALYTIWVLASVTWTINPVSGFGITGTGYAVAQLILSIVLMGPLVAFLRTEVDLRRALWTIWALAVITGLVSIGQFLGGDSRSVGASGDANFFAALQVVVLPLCALLAIETKDARARRFVLLGDGIIVGSVMTSLSRGGILALLGMFILLAFQPASKFFRTRARKRAFLAGALIGGLILLAVAYHALSQRTAGLFSGQDTGSGRTNLWRAAIVAWHTHEVHGIGIGAFIGQSNRLLLQTPGVNFSAYDLRSTGQYVHNAYLESLTELGIIGLVLFVAILIALFFSLRKSMHQATAAGLPFLSAFARALLMGLFAYALTSVFLSAETDRTLYTLIGLALALPRVIEMERLRRMRTEPAPEPTPGSSANLSYA